MQLSKLPSYRPPQPRDCATAKTANHSTSRSTLGDLSFLSDCKISAAPTPFVLGGAHTPYGSRPCSFQLAKPAKVSNSMRTAGAVPSLTTVDKVGQMLVRDARVGIAPPAPNAFTPREQVIGFKVT